MQQGLDKRADTRNLAHSTHGGLSPRLLCTTKKDGCCSCMKRPVPCLSCAERKGQRRGQWGPGELGGRTRASQGPPAGRGPPLASRARRPLHAHFCSGETVPEGLHGVETSLAVCLCAEILRTQRDTSDLTASSVSGSVPDGRRGDRPTSDLPGRPPPLGGTSRAPGSPRPRPAGRFAARSCLRPPIDATAPPPTGLSSSSSSAAPLDRPNGVGRAVFSCLFPLSSCFPHLPTQIPSPFCTARRH